MALAVPVSTVGAVCGMGGKCLTPRDGIWYKYPMGYVDKKHPNPQRKTY